MISNDFLINLNNVLQTVAEKLDLDPTRYGKAEKSYIAVGDWLKAETSDLHPYIPEIYPQGSFMLGTMVKPLEGDYDIDFVCLLEKGELLTSQDAYQKVGLRLEENGTYAEMLKHMNRCWRLEYTGDFHMDVIPAIPDLKRGGSAILVPDRELKNWTKSDPKEYANWFRNRMGAQFGNQKFSLAAKHNKEVEDIPDYWVKTSLQQAIQLMKRHRNIVFRGDQENNKPISIIITTLAGHVYETHGFQEDLFVTLKLMAEYMPRFVNPNIPRIQNPTNNEEDFADKWSDHPIREKTFFDWMTQLQADLEKLERFSSLMDSEENLKQMFGESLVNESIKELSIGSPIMFAVKSRFDVDHRVNPATKWKMAISSDYRVKVIGYIQHSESRTEEISNDCPPLSKGLSIYFLARTKNIDSPYEVHWQVVNTGNEAEAIENGGGLRGGFYDSQNSHKRNESTQYKGSHWVEAFIIKNEYCIARSGEFVVNIK